MAYNNLRFFKDTENDLNLKTKSSSYSDSFLQGSVFFRWGIDRALWNF